MPPATYVVTFTTADGDSFSTQVILEPDRQYHPEELIVTTTPPAGQPGRALVVTCERLPSEAEFRATAARAATRAARGGDEGRKLLDTLIPF